MIKESIQKFTETIFPELQNIRHELHANPELSFEEISTTAFIKSILIALDIEYTGEYAETGVVAYIRGKDPDSKCVALRADIDALPILETNDVDYKSKNEGVMHACGHDVHTTCLIGAAKILHELRDQLTGTVKFIFQPGEEKLPGGASIMLLAGVLEQPEVHTIYGQHVHPPLEVGKVGFRSGLYMASADEIYITVKGQGGHAALPDDLIDPIIVTTELLPALRAAVAKEKPELVPTVLAFGKVLADGATNVIPDQVTIEGTFRTMDEDWRKKVHSILERVAEEIATKHNCKIIMNVQKGYPCLVNDHKVTKHAKSWAQEYLGEDNVVDLPIRMTAEDFAFYTHAKPGCFYRLGTGNQKKGITSPVHTSTFDIDENALKTGAGLMAWLAYKQLQPEE